GPQRGAAEKVRAHAGAGAPRVAANEITSARAMQEQAVKSDGLGLKGVELDLGELAFLDFAPPINARLGFQGFAAVEPAKEFSGVFARSGLAIRGPGEGFDGVAAKKFVPVVIEEIAGSEDVAPSDVAPVSPDHSYNAVIFQTSSRLSETPLARVVTSTTAY